MGIDVLKRGFEEIIPADEFKERLGSKLRVKFGADPTGSDLHLGHAVVLNKLRQFQDAGHTVVFIIGDFTARIGDPSGRDETRPPLSEEEVNANARTYREQVFNILDEDKTEVVYNSEWFSEMGTADVLKLASRYTVARMLERDDFSKRFNNEIPIRIHEFMYPLLQGWDSVEVKSDIELGGTDQKFNLLVGRQFQKDENQQPQMVATLPILPGTDGHKKMSKTYDNHIPLKSKPRDMYGKLMSIPDHLILPYARLLTDFSSEDIVKIEKQLEADAVNPMQLKKNIALEITARYKGKDAALEGQDYFERTVAGGDKPHADEMQELTVGDEAVWIVELLDRSGLVESRGQAKRLLKQGAVYLDDERLEGLNHDIKVNEPVVLQVGKHRYCRLIS